MADTATVVDETVAAAETVVTETKATEVVAKEDGTLLSTADAEVKVEETPEQKTAREANEVATNAENKRLLEADDKTLKPEELAKKQGLVKAVDALKASVVPEKYEVKLDGVEVDATMLDALSPVFKDMKLTQGQVQKLAEAYAPVIKAQVEGQQKAAIDAWNKQGDDWKAESVKMLGANAKTEMAFAAKFMDRFGGKVVEGQDGKKTNELRVLMQDTKIGNNPVMLAAIIAAGKLLGEDKFVEGSNDGKGAEPSFYDHPTSKETLVYK